MSQRAAKWRGLGEVAAMLSCIVLLLSSVPARGDEPYARSRDYDLQHSRVALRFDLEQKKVIGEVTHTLSLLRDGLEKLSFDSVGLQIQSVKINKSKATFSTTENKLVVNLPKAGKSGEKCEVEINYEGKPTKGLYFVLPDKDYPNRPKQIWTQGESEDTRYYLPTYDYPNDRLTTETILTVPASWLTVANGKLVSTSDAAGGMKTWTWRESQPSSTYLFTVVAGEFGEVKDSWRNIPVTYYAPKDRTDRLTPNYSRTPAMIEYFSKRLGVDYPWEKYAQSMVDDFVAGGMENSSATTNTAESLRNPKLVGEYPQDEDGLISHELGHQWFGDLVTTKDWGNIWLNEGFATFLEYMWTEGHFGKEQADYERWDSTRNWFQMRDLYAKPIVRHDFEDSSVFDGNAYGKGAMVLYMLRHQLGEEAFYAGMKHYLEVNRGKNVVTPDFIKAMEESTHTNLDLFFDQWVYGAGAPKLEISYGYDGEKRQVSLSVKQTQKAEGRVGLFRVPVDVEITNATGPKLYPIVVSKAAETFTFPSESTPLMVLFDKGTQILKSVEFKKDKREWLYQLKNATELADCADAAVALGKLKDDEEATAALGEAMQKDKTMGVRLEAAEALGELGSPAAAKQLLNALQSVTEPELRATIVRVLGNFKENPEISPKLETIAKEDASWRARAAGLQSIGKRKSPNAYDILAAAVNGESPDGILRNAALGGLSSLADDKAVPLEREWTLPGKDFRAREAAIRGLAQLQKDNKEITNLIAGYLNDPHFRIRLTAVFALGGRGDASAIPALEALLKSNDLSIEVAPMIKSQIERLKNPAGKGGAHPGAGGEGEAAQAGPISSEDQRLSHLEHLVQEMNERLKAIEGRLPAVKQ
ncbi:MAG TPA: M1 family aminopeptidase [Candidatus Limnocylindrales bacterium]|nr:M1 family aminopeptidase [Candidatus Limnocylindrales bacterium]